MAALSLTLGSDPELATVTDMTDTLTYVYTPASPAAITPEPSSFLFLSTGLLDMAGVLRKRLA